MHTIYCLTSVCLTVYYANGMRALQVLLLILFSFFIFSGSVSAQTPSLSLGTSPTASPSPEVEKSVNYDLPYPGMLPDNPLYFLKGIRDKIIEILISDPVKKGEFYLLSSDKRLNSGYYLIEKGKDEMGVLYISKSGNYMHMAVSTLKKAGDKGRDTLSTAATAIKKHKEIINNVRGDVDQKYSSELQNEIKRLEEIETSILGKK